jgi:hypothetical protein
MEGARIAYKQEVRSSSLRPPTTFFNRLQATSAKIAHPVAQPQVLDEQWRMAHPISSAVSDPTVIGAAEIRAGGLLRGQRPRAFAFPASFQLECA